MRAAEQIMISHTLMTYKEYLGVQYVALGYFELVSGGAGDGEREPLTF